MSILNLSLTAVSWRPFIDALPIGDLWLPIMVAAIFLVALTYRTIRREDLSDVKILLVESSILGGQILSFIVAAAAVIWIVTALA